LLDGEGTNSGKLIIADFFENTQIKTVESLLKKHFFIEKKEQITFQVKHAMSLDKPRIDKIASKITKNS